MHEVEIVPRSKLIVAILVILVFVLLYAVGVFFLAHSAWGAELPGSCWNGTQCVVPNSIWGAPYGCPPGYTWQSTSCPAVTPTPTPVPTGTPGIRPPRRNLSPCAGDNPPFRLRIPTLQFDTLVAVIQCWNETCVFEHNGICQQLYPWQTWVFDSSAPGNLTIRCPMCFEEFAFFTRPFAYSFSIRLDPDPTVAPLLIESRNFY